MLSRLRLPELPEAARQGIARELNRLDYPDQDHHGAHRDSRTETLVAVAYGEIAESPTAE